MRDRVGRMNGGPFATDVPPRARECPRTSKQDARATMHGVNFWRSASHHDRLRRVAASAVADAMFYEFPTARFSNLVNSRINASLTVRVGPLRCLPLSNSATPCASGGGWLLSAY